MTDIDAKKLGFRDINEYFLYEDVCGTEVPMSVGVFDDILSKKLNDIRKGKKNDSSKASGFKKELFEQYIKDNNFSLLFDKVKDMSVIDRLIEVYIYHFNELSLCLISRKNYENKINAAIDLFDGGMQQKYEKLMDKVDEDARKHRNVIDFITIKKSERLTALEIKKFDDAVRSVHDSYDNLFFLIDGMDGKSK